MKQYKAGENGSNVRSPDFSGADERFEQDMNDDPMRVRGSFYLGKTGMDGFGGNQASKSPKSKKVSPPNRIGYPKKKKQLRLAPLGINKPSGVQPYPEMAGQPGLDGGDPLRVSRAH